MWVLAQLGISRDFVVFGNSSLKMIIDCQLKAVTKFSLMIIQFLDFLNNLIFEIV